MELFPGAETVKRVSGGVSGRPAVPVGDVLHYETMVTRVAHEYDTRFQNI